MKTGFFFQEIKNCVSDTVQAIHNILHNSYFIQLRWWCVFKIAGHLKTINNVWVLVRTWRDGSNEYPQSMFWSENKKLRYTLHSPVFLNKSGVQRDIYCIDMFS